MELGVLGPVEVRVGGRPLDAGHARRRAVLAVLLLDLGHVVSREALIDRVWGEEAPTSVLNTLYGYVARLRAVIARAADPHVALSRGPGGYLLRAQAEQLDLGQFRRLRAAAADGADDRRQARLLRQALALWRGQALTGVQSPWLNAMRDTLEEERLAALADLHDIRLRHGEHRLLVGELAEQAAARPGDERLIAQLMLALYRSGRQADALRWFERTRRQVAAEVGADLGPGLRTLHQRILRADPALIAAASLSLHPGAGSRAPGAPALSRPAVAFTGRTAALADLDASGPAGTEAAPAAVVAISGTAGVGKTALARHWASRSARLFGDGQLQADLRGFGPGAAAATAETLGGFLAALGRPAADIPVGPGERAALYRSLLADRQVLIVLDNARDEQQVRPLLPGSPGSLVLVTSRRQLTGLAATDGARLVTLDVLSHGEAVRLLTDRLGRQASAEPEAIDEIADHCARLPFALAVAAARAAAQPQFPLAALAAELREAGGRLDALDGGDPAASLRTLFSWSYRQLSVEAARLFGLLGLHPGAGITLPGAARLAGVDEAEGRRLLRELSRACLLREDTPGRYRLPGLLRVYAAEQARSGAAGPCG